MTSAISSAFAGASQAAQYLFKQADKDQDGAVTKAELEAVKPAGEAPPGAPSVDDLFANGDADGDGKLTQSELEEGLKKSFSKVSDDTQSSLLALQDQSSSDPLQDLVDALLKALDDNKDGKIDKSDIESLKKKQQEAASQAKDAQDQSNQDNVTLEIQISTVGANDNANGYSGRTATLSFLLSFQETSAAA